MAKFNLQTNPSSYRRVVAKSPEAVLKNRFIEANPVLNDSEFSYISRPGMKKWIEVGTGHIRKVFNEPGVFNGDLFVVSGLSLYRVDTAGTASLLGQLGTQALGDVSMAASAPVGNFPANLYIAEGGVLWVYTENGSARGTLDVNGAITTGEQVRIDGTYYQFTSGSVDAGTPLGTAANPWLVAMGASTNEALDNLYDAINLTGVAGTAYSTATTEHPTVSAQSAGAGVLTVQADAAGALGNAIVTTETLVNGAWGGATLAGGGAEQLRQVPVPDDFGAISVAHINSYIIVVVVQDEAAGTVGRFYWINPGENTVDALNFATAERSPDKLHQVVVFNDMFWLLGEKTVEPWITTGQAAAPMQRYRPILVDRGSWEGTAVKIKDSLIMVDEDGAVFQVKGGAQRISTPQIEERIRRAIQLENKLS